MKKTTFLATMAIHFAAFQAKAVLPYEKREEPTLGTIAETIDKLGTAFEEYKNTNDARLVAIEEGKSTADLDAKLGRIDESMDDLSEQKSRLEKLETKLARPGAFGGGGRDQRESDESLAYKSAFYDWIRAPPRRAPRG